MRVKITGRHVVMTDALRRYIENRMRRLDRYGLKLGDVQVVAVVEKYRHVAEATVKVNGVTIQGKASTHQMYASIDQVLEKIGRQIQKRKAKLTDHRPVAGSPRPVRKRREGAAQPRGVATVRPPLQTLTVGEALNRLSDDRGALVVFVNPSVNRVQVVRRTDGGTVELIDPQPPSSAAR